MAVKKIGGIVSFLAVKASLGIFTIVLAFSSCVSIKEVNTASTSAVATLKTYNNIGFTFTGSYKDYRAKRNLYDNSNMPIILNDSVKIADKLREDKTVNLLLSSLSSYFSALGKLSDSGLVNYDFSKLTSAIKADSPALLKDYKITTSQVDAASKISSIITNDIMGAYREKKVRSIIIEYNPYLDSVIGGLENLLEIAQSEISLDTGYVNSKYFVPLNDASLDKGTKTALKKEYSDERSQLESQKEALEKLQAALTTTKTAFDSLSAEAKHAKLNSSTIKNILNQYSGDIYSIYQQIELLQKK